MICFPIHPSSSLPEISLEENSICLIEFSLCSVWRRCLLVFTVTVIISLCSGDILLSPLPIYLDTKVNIFIKFIYTIPKIVLILFLSSANTYSLRNTRSPPAEDTWSIHLIKIVYSFNWAITVYETCGGGWRLHLKWSSRLLTVEVWRGLWGREDADDHVSLLQPIFIS